MSWIGNYGKFSERMKKIKLDRLKVKKGKITIENSDNIYNNFLKVVAAIPMMVYDNVFLDDTSCKLKEKKDSDVFSVNKKKKLEIISNIDVSQIKKRQDSQLKKANSDRVISLKDTTKCVNKKQVENNVDHRELEKRIMNLIKKNLITMVNELEIIQSDLYVLSEINREDKTLIECRRNVDEVKKMLCKIDKLKKKYDFLKDNFDFEYMLETDDLQLVDDIITLKDTFEKTEVRALVEDYKLLDVYKFLYLRIDQLREDTYRFEEYKNMKVEELKQRDINFEEIKKEVYNISKVNDDYNSFVKNQNDFLIQLSKKVSQIDAHETTNYRLRGFNQLLLNSFKYVGLIMLSPLKGVIPSIATETLITKNVVSNLYKNISCEEIKKMVYDAIDYSSEITMAISDLNSTENLVDLTLEDIVKLKIKYNEEFKKYQGDFLEYEEVIGKINDMENKILGNKIKIEIMKKKMYEKERENQKKLVRVNELNSKAA